MANIRIFGAVLSLAAIQGAMATSQLCPNTWMHGHTEAVADCSAYAPGGTMADMTMYQTCLRAWKSALDTKLREASVLYQKCLEVSPEGIAQKCQIVTEGEVTAADCPAVGNENQCKVAKMWELLQAKTPVEKTNFARCKEVLGATDVFASPCYVKIVKPEMTTFQATLADAALKACDLDVSVDCRAAVLAKWLTQPALGGDHAAKAEQFWACGAVLHGSPSDMCTDIVLSQLPANANRDAAYYASVGEKYIVMDKALKDEFAHCREMNPPAPVDQCQVKTVMTQGQRDEVSTKCADAAGDACHCCSRKVMGAVFDRASNSEKHDFDMCKLFFWPTSILDPSTAQCLRWEVRQAMNEVAYTTEVKNVCGVTDTCIAKTLAEKFRHMSKNKQEEITATCLP